MKNFKIVFCLIFVLFAAFQYNDVDPYLWIPIYLFAALVCLLSFLDRASNYFFLVALVGYAAGFAFYIPSLVEWIQLGMPSITGTMKAESPFVELIREALGLLICFISIGVIYLSYRRQHMKRVVSSARL